MNSSVRRKLETARRRDLNDRLHSKDELTRRLALLEQELEAAKQDEETARLWWGSNSPNFKNMRERRIATEAALEQAKAKLSRERDRPAMP